jgi:uncharacterized protein YndB with AHSA1/START domain
MLSVTSSTVIPADPERVWEILCDTTRYAEWVEATDAVTRSDGPARQGSTYDEVNPIVGPWKARTTWTILEFAPPRRQVHTSADVPLASRFDVVTDLAPEGSGTRFTLTLRASPSLGPVGLAFERLMTGIVERRNRRTLENLVELVRREDAGSTPA